MIRAALIAVIWATGAGAFTLDLPPPAQERASDTQTRAISLPTGPWQGRDTPERRIEGVVSRTAWRLPGQGRTLQQILRPVREALVDAGYDPAFDCADQTCGGYDFRYSLDLLPPPAMFVDLGNYRYLLASGPDGVVAIVVSRAADAGYLHVTHARPVSAGDASAVDVAPEADVAPGPAADPGLWDMLQAEGRAVLEDLSFGTGSAALTGESFASLETLADGLAANPTARVALVGHTDAEGGLEPNLTLSRDRAAAVRRVLIDRFGIDGARITAEGVAYLAPRASNASAEGREANRRVEVVLTAP